MRLYFASIAFVVAFAGCRIHDSFIVMSGADGYFQSTVTSYFAISSSLLTSTRFLNCACAT